MKACDSEGFIESLKLTLQTYITRLDNNTFTKKDLQDLKTQTEEYFKKKEQFAQDITNIDKSNT